MRRVAMKFIREDLLADPAAVQRFYREIEAAARLSHPNIVMAFEADEVNGTHFFATEYVEGVDLRKLIATAGPTRGLACEAVRQAALGLHHAHLRGRRPSRHQARQPAPLPRRGRQGPRPGVWRA